MKWRVIFNECLAPGKKLIKNYKLQIKISGAGTRPEWSGRERNRNFKINSRVNNLPICIISKFVLFRFVFRIFFESSQNSKHAFTVLCISEKPSSQRIISARADNKGIREINSVFAPLQCYKARNFIKLEKNTH